MNVGLAVFTVCLLYAAFTDWRCCQVYNFTWWIGALSLAPGLWKYAGTDREAPELLVELTLYCLIQMAVAGRIYGRADGYAFAECALALSGMGLGLKMFLIQMIISYAALFVVQICRGNINKFGNLKNPVPFVPYIVFAFLCVTISC